ncbi:hypothetical protein B0H16DRAFT_1725602 [Mycena metata]|uniref:Uncharacterized protein n=1 Tax=Mycena metata TaxID=1033252 RepID=A0AAD7IS06_9AGAR|nr:hypothetical protein B0H16DRAFT_1725602 [Mycena metata]
MDNKGNDPLQRVRPLQARRIRVIAISLPILLLSGYTLFERLANQQPQKNIARPIPGRNSNESFKAPGGESKEETW